VTGPIKRLAARNRRLVRRMTEVHSRLALAIGAVVLGLVALLFAKAADRAQDGFTALVARWPYVPLVLTPLGFALIVWLTRRFVPAARGSGIPQVVVASRYPDRAGPLITLRTAGAKLVATVAMLGLGASVGREGPTVQVSAAIMVWLHRLMRVPLTAGVLIAGGAAGVAAAFNTPLAGVAFAIEELAAAYEQRMTVLAMGAVMIAGLVSLGIAGDYVYFGVLHDSLSLRAVVMIAPVAGVVGGALGGLFSRAVLGFGGWSWPPVAWLRSRPVLFAAACGLVVAVIGIGTHGSTWGTGYGATRAMVESGGGSAWFGPLKLVTTLATTLSGAPGGIFAPSLAVGAGVGRLIAPLFAGQPTGAIVLLGMTAYFVGVVRAPFTAIIIISETTGSHAMILPLFATALIADGVAPLFCRERLYHGLARQFGPVQEPTR
jgi:H+/Cl- antiporter ClcA